MNHFHCLNVRKGITAALLGQFLLWGKSGLYAQEFRFERFGAREGVLSKCIFAGVQDHKGYLWFGTDEGLLRYDGYQFKAYQYDPAKKNSFSDSKVYEEDELKNKWFKMAGVIHMFWQTHHGT